MKLKKIFGVIILAAVVCAVLAACSGGSSVSPAWADKEVLKYSIADKTSVTTTGEMTVINERRPADKTLGGKSYDADGKTTVEIKIADKEIKIVFLTKQYTVLAEEKTYKSESESYVLNAYHSGKNAVYSYDGGEEKKIKVGSTGYTEGEYIYNYIRSYSFSSLPASIKVADYATGRVKTVTTGVYSQGKLTVPFPDGARAADCTQVAIALSDTPQGDPIYVWFADDTNENKVGGLSISPSKKFPVKITENNLVYTLTEIVVE